LPERTSSRPRPPTPTAATRFAQEPPGDYTVGIEATGFGATRVNDVVAAAGTNAVIRTPLLRAATSGSSSYREIGRTTSGVGGITPAATSTIQHNIDPSQIQQQGFLKSGGRHRPVTGRHLTGGPHTVGDDTSIDIRGMGAGEVRPLLRRSPDRADRRPRAGLLQLRQFAVRFARQHPSHRRFGRVGSLRRRLIGGTIDFQTLSPTARPHEEFTQSVGNDGTLGSIFKATGTIGRLGYAFGHSVSGTYGDFAPGQIFQGARPNNNANAQNGGACTGSNDITTCNTALNTTPSARTIKNSRFGEAPLQLHA